MTEAQVSVSSFNRLLDKALMLADGVTAVTPSATGAFGVVDSAARVIDLGVGQVKGEMIVDLQALDVNAGTEVYYLFLQGSDNVGFTSGVRPLATLILGSPTLTLASAVNAAGRYIVPFRNTVYRPLAPAAPLTPSRFVRSAVQGLGAGIGASSFDYIAYLSLDVE